ncbi:MAG TPA: DUF2934 domain-containing protein [Tepidisphaeraceae bacterium]|jgi:hypothetical protein|nr:DUF2934 domain-containing protein [Tepidisphaeraceae bacterium]
MNSKKPSNPSHSKSSTSRPAPATTVARNSPIPRPSSTKREVSHEMIAKRAYEIYVSGRGGSQADNWLRAERELKSL